MCVVCTIKYNALGGERFPGWQGYSSRMGAALVAVSAQEELVKEALATVSLPKGVRLLRFFFDTDHTGDPAVRVVYGVSKKVPLTARRGRELAALSQATSFAIRDTGIDRFAYTTFDDVR